MYIVSVASNTNPRTAQKRGGMKTKKEIGVFRFKDNERYEKKDSLKEFYQFFNAEKYADKIWQKEQCYGGYVVKHFDKCVA